MINIKYGNAQIMITVIVHVYAATFSPNFMSKSRGASYMCISSFKPFYPHKIPRQNQQDTA